MIRLTKLSNAINKMNYVAWAKKGLHSYIISDHFILNTTQEIKGSALNKLISFLGTVPQEDEGIISKYGKREVMEETDINNWINMLDIKDAEPIIFTDLIHQHQRDSKLYSIFKSKEDYIFLDTNYVDLINLHKEDIEIYGTTKHSPIYFKRYDEELMILPINLSVPFYLKEE